MSADESVTKIKSGSGNGNGKTNFIVETVISINLGLFAEEHLYTPKNIAQIMSIQQEHQKYCIEQEHQPVC